MKTLLSLLLFTNFALAADPAAVTAIDILLEPDATMLRHAEANNARLLAVFAKPTPEILKIQADIIAAVKPFESFTFSPAGAAVYQLGPFGTAAKKLKEWDLKP